MNIFFAGSSSAKQNYGIYRNIISYLHTDKQTVLQSWIVDVVNDKEAGAHRDVLVQQEALLREADMMIVEASTPSFGIGYLIHQAIRSHLPVLCLYPEGHSDKELSTVIAGNDSSLVSLRSYNNNNLSSVLKDYVVTVGDNELIKFNFLANKEITDFLEKKATALNKSKSEYLRDVLNEIIRKKEK